MTIVALLTLAAACGSSAETPSVDPSPADPTRPTTTAGGGGAPTTSPAVDGGFVTGGDSACVPGASRACSVPGALGSCASGQQRCERAGQGEDGLFVVGWTACVGPAPLTEVCNGVDDDCDGAIDEGLSCGPPPPPPVDAGSPPVDAGPPPPPPSDPPCSERCDGAVSYVDQTAKYGLWVKVVRCKSPGRYDLYLGPTASGPFSKIGDDNLSGQDHCELVNPAFTMADDATMSVGQVEYGGAVYQYPAAYGVSLYHRAHIGEPFKYAADATTEKNAMTSCWYECGVSF
ncbi:MAG: hypothetical protein U0235_35500 [Polyangiaceae bacterium]